jgi:hypothetical protein
MATTLETVAAHLKAEGLKFEVHADRAAVFTGFQTNLYRDTEGRNAIFIVVDLQEEGRYVRVIAPNCYSYKDGPHRDALFQACLMISYATKMVQFEYDPSDGEVRAVIEFPLEDAELTQKQLVRCVRALMEIIDHFHPTIEKAMKAGVAEIPAEEDPREIARLFEEFVRQRRASAAVGAPTAAPLPPAPKLDLEE